MKNSTKATSRSTIAPPDARGHRTPSLNYETRYAHGSRRCFRRAGSGAEVQGQVSLGRSNQVEGRPRQPTDMGSTGSTGIEHAVEDRQVVISTQSVDVPPAPQVSSEDQAVEHEVGSRAVGPAVPDPAIPEAFIFPVAFARGDFDVPAECLPDLFDLSLSFLAILHTEHQSPADGPSRQTRLVLDVQLRLTIPAN